MRPELISTNAMVTSNLMVARKMAFPEVIEEEEKNSAKCILPKVNTLRIYVKIYLQTIKIIENRN